MDNFDYRQYSLSNLEKWIEDAVNSSEASPQEIYDVIKNVVADNYYCYKNNTERCYELLALLNGNGKNIMQSPNTVYVSEDGDIYPTKDKVVKWQLPIEIDGASGEYYIQFPDDLMEAANIKENDMVEWVPQDNGSYLLKKVNG